MDLVNLNTARTISCFGNKKSPKKDCDSETTSETQFLSLSSISGRKCFDVPLQHQPGEGCYQPKGPSWATCSSAGAALGLPTKHTGADEFADVAFPHWFSSDF